MVNLTFKSHCDHCGILVDQKYWTFNMKQCVVCADHECNAKQKGILRSAMDDVVEGVLEGRIKL